MGSGARQRLIRWKTTAVSSSLVALNIIPRGMAVAAHKTGGTKASSTTSFFRNDRSCSLESYL